MLGPFLHNYIFSYTHLDSISQNILTDPGTNSFIWIKTTTLPFSFRSLPFNMHLTTILPTQGHRGVAYRNWVFQLKINNAIGPLYSKLWHCKLTVKNLETFKNVIHNIIWRKHRKHNDKTGVGIGIPLRSFCAKLVTWRVKRTLTDELARRMWWVRRFVKIESMKSSANLQKTKKIVSQLLFPSLIDILSNLQILDDV